MNLSVLLIWAFWAARCAWRRRRTRCSGDSPGMRGELTLDAADDVEPPPADFDVAWGMVDVKRVASLTLRGPILDAMVGGLMKEKKKVAREMIGASGGGFVVGLLWVSVRRELNAGRIELGEVARWRTPRGRNEVVARFVLGRGKFGSSKGSGVMRFFPLGTNRRRWEGRIAGW